jgi:hypothetical protein
VKKILIVEDEVDLANALKIRFDPLKTVLSSPSRYIFTTDPSVISRLIDETEQVRKIDFPGSWFMASWIICNLNMFDLRKVTQDCSRQFPFHHLHMIDVILKPEVGMIDFFKKLKGILCVDQVKSRNVLIIERFDEQENLLLLQCTCSNRRLLTNVWRTFSKGIP